MIGGLNILLSDDLPTEEDWSACRSPSRAKRRHRQGHKQHMRLVPRSEAYVAGRSLIVSRQMLEKMKARIDADIIKQVLGHGSAMTYSCFNEEQAMLTVDMIKDSVKKLGLDKIEPDPFDFSIMKPMDIAIKPRRYW